MLGETYGVGEEAGGVAEAGYGGEEGDGFVVVWGLVVLQVGGCYACEVEGAEEVDFEDDVCWRLVDGELAPFSISSSDEAFRVPSQRLRWSRLGRRYFLARQSRRC